jgi:hypothetical protein
MVTVSVDESQMLRQAVRDFLEAAAPEDRVRQLMDTPDAADPQLWSALPVSSGCPASPSPRITAVAAAGGASLLWSSKHKPVDPKRSRNLGGSARS